MSFSKKIIQSVWEKGEIIADFNASRFRKDHYGTWIRRWDYGGGNSNLGWRIDHITPESEGGGDGLANLRPLNWRNK